MNANEFYKDKLQEIVDAIGEICYLTDDKSKRELSANPGSWVVSWMINEDYEPFATSNDLSAPLAIALIEQQIVKHLHKVGVGVACIPESPPYYCIIHYGVIGATEYGKYHEALFAALMSCRKD